MTLGRGYGIHSMPILQLYLTCDWKLPFSSAFICAWWQFSFVYPTEQFLDLTYVGKFKAIGPYYVSKWLWFTCAKHHECEKILTFLKGYIIGACELLKTTENWEHK